MATYYKLPLFIVMILCCVLSAKAQSTIDEMPKDKAKVQQKIENYRKIRLIEILELEGEEVEKFFGAYTSKQTSVKSAKDNVDQKARAIRELVEGNATESSITAAIAALQSAQSEFLLALEARNKAVKAVLTSKQYAQYLAFEVLFVDELASMVFQRAASRRGRK
jgi:flagellar hook-basal body complex protein FliE